MATQRELREAYRKGLARMANHPAYDEAYLDMLARDAYPPKMVTRPREVRGRGEFLYRVIDGQLQCRDLNANVARGWRPYLIDEMQEIVCGLFANPSEYVEDDS